MDLRLGPYRSEAPRSPAIEAVGPHDREGWLLLFVLAAVGAIPWMALLWTGRSSPFQLGMGLLLIAFSAVQAARTLRTPR